MTLNFLHQNVPSIQFCIVARVRYVPKIWVHFYPYKNQFFFQKKKRPKKQWTKRFLFLIPPPSPNSKYFSPVNEIILCKAYAASKRFRQTFNKLPPPPPKKKSFFWGGGGGGEFFLKYFHEFLSLEHKKKFGTTLGQSRCFGIIIGQFRPLPAILWLCEIQKIWDF